MSRDGAAVVEPLRAAVRSGHAPPASEPDEGLPALALVSPRDEREAQWGDGLRSAAERQLCPLRLTRADGPQPTKSLLPATAPTWANPGHPWEADLRSSEAKIGISPLTQAYLPV